ncbi:unnamed protein product [Linum tenue]|uniref:CCHC-type domain-containing protein n=1 Tax=Linum tenue TaxID=586396 RepID=A0AAV0HQB5_9ROSI|nr:unnamed protein product [Linum tenue]
MLSTDCDGSCSSAPALLPSDRPPDQPDPSFSSAPFSLTIPMAPAIPSSEMVIDSSPLPVSLSQQGMQSKEVGERKGQSEEVVSATNPGSYARALTGPASRAPSPNQLIQWTPVGEHDLVTEEHNGEPALRVSPQFKAKICAPWQKTLVVRLLGLRIGFVTMCNRLKGLWRPCGAMEVKDLDHDCFLVKLDNEQDYFRALTDGPWVIHDHYLVVQQWTPKFKASDPLPKTMIVWVQLPALKIHFYHKEVLNTLGNLIGRTIKLDYHTLTQQRAKFARLAVEVDLSRHLVPRIWLDDEWQKVEYENLPEICFKCGKIGHSAAGCPLNNLPTLTVPAAVTGNLPPESLSAEPIDANPGFGPWMMVTRKSRRNPREAPRKGKSVNETSNQISGSTNKSGKGGAIIKESLQAGPSMASPNAPLQQRVSNQERKGKTGGEASKKGKEKVAVVNEVQGNGLLGPGPGHLNPNNKGPIRPKSSNVASSSNNVASEQANSEKALESPSVSVTMAAQDDFGTSASSPA